jgi:hypothetical protein
VSEKKSFPPLPPKPPRVVPEILKDVSAMSDTNSDAGGEDKTFDGLSREELISSAKHLHGELLHLLNRPSSGAKEHGATGEILSTRRFNHLTEPPPLRAVYTLAGIPIATRGNLVAIAAGVKAGKSAVMGALCASTMTGSGDADLLSFASGNPYERSVVWIDSEQSPDDFWHCVMRAVKRAGLTEPPAWLHAYCLTGLDCKKAWDCVLEAIRAGIKAHRGIHSILLDGIADFVGDVNDAEQCNSFIAQVHALAIEHDCPIVGVIHFNPGGEKTRGHLGSQFERKAETNLRLDKKDDVTVIWSDKQRRAPIPKKGGPCFAWSEEAGMHVSVENPDDEKAEAREESRIADMRAQAEQVFAQGEDPMRHKDAIEKMVAVLKLSEVGAKKKLRKWRECNIVNQESLGRYTLTQAS